MFRGNASQFELRTARLKCGALAVAAVLGLICMPADVSAQSRKMEQAGTALQALLPLAGAFCAYKQNDFNNYSSGFFDQSGQYVPAEAAGYGGTSNGGTDNWRTDDSLSIVAGHDAAVSSAGYLNQNCISSPSGRAVVGGLAAFANTSDLLFKGQEIGVFSMGTLVGFDSKNLKFKVGPHRVNLKFSLDF